ncbi:MAG: T9SS type A sorting domain-containing protein [Bacteroidota bacterium]
MKQYLFSLLFLFLFINLCRSQVYVGSSGIYIEDSTQISVQSDVILQGSVAGAGELVLSATQIQHLDGNANLISRLRLSNPSEVIMVSDLSIRDSLFLEMGILNLQNHVVNLEPTSWLKEDENSRIRSSGGYFESIRDLPAVQDSNLAGTGLYVSQSSNIGFSVLRRGHTPQTWQGENSIPRYFEFISPATDSLEQLQLYFSTAELHPTPDQEWVLMRSANSGNSWELVEEIHDNNTLIPVKYAATSYRWTLFPNTISLPVEWLWLAAKWEEEASQIDWIAQEENVSQYFIQRSIDGRLFGDIGQLNALQNGAEANSYQFRDAEARSLGLGQLYYRIRQIDHDGQSSFSKIMTVKIPQARRYLMVMVTPNPVQDIVYYQYQNSSNNPLELQMSTTLGKVLHQQSLAPSIGKLSKGEILVNQLSAGYYFLRLSDEQGVSTFKFVKE